MLSEESKNSLIQLTDPFHDFEVECIGLPDGLPEKSIVRKIKKSITIARPSTFPADEPWDVHICSMPERRYVVGSTNNTTHVDMGGFNSNGIFNESSNSHVLAPMLVYSVGADGQTFPTGGPYVPGNVNEVGVDFNDYFYGQSRVIASAFEVHDVSSELYKQGTCTVYRLPQFSYDSTTLHTQTNGYSTSPTVVSRMPPGNLEQAMLLPGSRQWEAKWGCYCVDTYDLEENRPSAAEFGTRQFVVGDLPGSYAVTSLNSMALWRKYDTTLLPAATYFKPIPRDTSGAFFTGLSPNSSLTLTVVMVIETFPTFTDPLVTLARSTPEMDPTFFMLYKAISQEIPAGVMVGENASGDFWDKILGIVSDVAPTLGIAFGPAGKAVGTGIGMAAKVAQQARNSKKPDNSNFKDLKGKGTSATPPSVKNKSSKSK